MILLHIFMLESFTPIYSNSVKKYDTLLSAICLLYVLMDDKFFIFWRIIPLMGLKNNVLFWQLCFHVYTKIMVRVMTVQTTNSSLVGHLALLCCNQVFSHWHVTALSLCVSLCLSESMALDVDLCGQHVPKSVKYYLIKHYLIVYLLAQS